MSTGRPILIDRAGPSGAAAAVLHPDDPLPKTWRVVSHWTYRGQRGAWLEYDRKVGSSRHGPNPDLCQVVYRTTAKHSPRTSTTGQALSYAARGLVCSQAWIVGWTYLPGYHEPQGMSAQQDADRAARLAHLGLTLDQARDQDRTAAQELSALVREKALKTDPLGLHHEDSKLIEGWAEWSLRRARDYGVSEAMELFEAELSEGAKPWGKRIRPMVEARVRRKLDRITVPPPSVEGLLDRPEIPDVFRQAFE